MMQQRLLQDRPVLCSRNNPHPLVAIGKGLLKRGSGAQHRRYSRNRNDRHSGVKLLHQPGQMNKGAVQIGIALRHKSHIAALLQLVPAELGRAVPAACQQLRISSHRKDKSQHDFFIRLDMHFYNFVGIGFPALFGSRVGNYRTFPQQTAGFERNQLGVTWTYPYSVQGACSNGGKLSLHQRILIIGMIRCNCSLPGRFGDSFFMGGLLIHRVQLMFNLIFL
ncbi:hypothetical protein D3C74_367280 [compost metagenome]